MHACAGQEPAGRASPRTALLAVLMGAALSLILPRAFSLAAAGACPWQALPTDALSCASGTRINGHQKPATEYAEELASTIALSQPVTRSAPSFLYLRPRMAGCLAAARLGSRNGVDG